MTREKESEAMIQISVYYVAIFVGLCLSLLMEIKLGISPGGIVVPGYLGLILDRPGLVVNVVLCSLVAYLIVKFLLSRWMLIYGKRRFVACIMVALLFKALLGLLYPLVPFSVFVFSGVGVAAGGILANTYFKQGVALTLGACAAISGVVFGMVLLISLL